LEGDRSTPEQLARVVTREHPRAGAREFDRPRGLAPAAEDHARQMIEHRREGGLTLAESYLGAPALRNVFVRHERVDAVGSLNGDDACEEPERRQSVAIRVREDDPVTLPAKDVHEGGRK